MKNSPLLFGLLLITLFACQPAEQATAPTVNADDVLNFWNAYDLVTATTDSAAQADILEREFFAKGTPGLAAIMEARRYTKEEYRQGINAYPKFWASMRENMLRAPEMAAQIQGAAQRFFELYPQQQPVEVYFTVGCFLTNGTVLDSLMLIGTELAMAGPDVDLSEWPERMDGLRPYMESSPIEGLVFLNTHEFGHTQQTTRQGYNLLSQCIFEGVPEFMATLALEQPSTTPAVAFGKANDARVRAAFANEIGAEFYSNWLQNDTDNQFGVRDLGYYAGYALVEKYYDAAEDKAAAIKYLIEFDYTDSAAVNQFVDQLHYFDRPVAAYLSEYQAKHPTVTHVTQLENNATGVDPAITELTFHFSAPLNTYFRNTNYGPLGEAYLPKMNGAATAEDGLSATYQVGLEPGRKYQFTLGNGYRTEEGMRLVPYTLTFETAGTQVQGER